MKISINSLLKIVLVVTFFCSAAFADGDMSNGGKSCTSNCPGFAAGHNQSDTQATAASAVNAFDETESSASDLIENFLISLGLV